MNNNTMLRDWGDRLKKPFDDDGDDDKNDESPSQAVDANPSTHTRKDAGGNDSNPFSSQTTTIAVPPVPPPPPAAAPVDNPFKLKDPGIFRKWEAANRRYEETQRRRSEEEDGEKRGESEVAAEDPLSSPGNSSCYSAGWSVGPGGMIDRGGGNPFLEAKDEDEDQEGGEATRKEVTEISSSPRQVQSRKHSLSVVKEEEEKGGKAEDAENSFDDVDLEACARSFAPGTNGGNNNTDNNGNNNDNRNSHSHSNSRSNSGDGDDGDDRDGGEGVLFGEIAPHRLSGIRRRAGVRHFSMANRFLGEFRSHPTLRFRIAATASTILAAACLVLISVITSRSGGRGRPITSEAERADALSMLELLEGEIDGKTPVPTASLIPSKFSLAGPSENPTMKPTKSPSMTPTYEPTAYPTEPLTTTVPTTAPPTAAPTDGPTTTSPSFSPTTPIPTYSPSQGPVTLTPTRDCTNSAGTYMTYNDKLRDCEWLDNGNNGAKSARMDLNCLDSALGDACRYTCRLYNGCMEYLLSSLPDYASQNNISVGNRCRDKDGMWMSNGNVPRQCAWLEVDPETAPVKKSLNCGTPDVRRTELGIMCPGSCAGYNDCPVHGGGGSTGSTGGSKELDINEMPSGILSVLVGGEGGDFHEQSVFPLNNIAPDDPTFFPTYGLSDVPTNPEERCRDRDGEFRTHMGTFRGCRWFRRDDVEGKKRLNCDRTEIGRNCLESCPCPYAEEGPDTAADGKVVALSVPAVPAASIAAPQGGCRDEDGEFETQEGTLRQCRWLNLDGVDKTVEEKKEANCGVTEIGRHCLESCPCVEEAMVKPVGGVLVEMAGESNADGDATAPGVLIVPTAVRGRECRNKDGEFKTHMGTLRNCRWLNRDGEEATAKEKRDSNCAVTEIGLNCLEYCPCPHWDDGLAETGQLNAAADLDEIMGGGVMTPGNPTTAEAEECQDKEGEFETHAGTLRQCRWLNRDGGEGTTEEKKEQNCGVTEIGLNCLESCFCNAGPLPTGSPSFVPTDAPTPHPDSKGVFDASGDVLTLAVLADASISEREEDTNFGESKRLNVAHNDGKQRQSLLLFDLTFAAKSFGPVIGRAILSIYFVAIGDSSGGVTMKKMADTTWSENEVTWNNTLGSGEPDSDEPIISFVDGLESNTWYEIDVTAAVRDALEKGESRLGIRIVASDQDTEVLYFGSKERVREPPTLAIFWRTAVPTTAPTYFPTFTPSTSPPTFLPSSSPTVPLDCMDKKGTFITQTGESQPCSWLSTGNGSLKKEFNCNINRNDESSAAMFCQSQCSVYNGCDEMHCQDMAGTYMSHTGWEAQCSWLWSGQGRLKLEQNCIGDEEGLTELGKRCQKTCGDYNGCNARKL